MGEVGLRMGDWRWRMGDLEGRLTIRHRGERIPLCVLCARKREGNQKPARTTETKDLFCSVGRGVC